YQYECVGCQRPQQALILLGRCLEVGEVILGRRFRGALLSEGVPSKTLGQCYGGGKSSEIDVRSREWKYRIEGHEPGGKWLAIVFSFKTIARAFLITVFSIESRRRAR